MKLNEIIFEDYRQFFGRQSFTFSSSSDLPVNMIFGANGSGKTTFLNAFTWALYGAFSDDVESQDRIINNLTWNRLKPGEIGRARVTLRFEHGESVYEVSREVTGTRNGNESSQNLHYSDPIVGVANNQGVIEWSKNPQSEINAILPKNLAQFFFFNGERMENLLKKSSYSDVKEEVRGLLDLSQVERLKDKTLPSVQKKLTNDLKQQDDGKASEIEQNIQKTQDKIDRNQSLRDDYNKNISANSNQIEVIQARLSEIDEIKPLIDRRTQLDQLIADCQKSIESIKTELKKELLDKGFLAFSSRMTEFAASSIQKLKSEGILPAPMSREFLVSLLEREECVCGNQLIEGTESRKAVENAKDASRSTESTRLWHQLEGALPGINETRNEILARVKRLRDELASQETMRDGYFAEKENISQTILNKNLDAEDHEDPAKLEEKIKELESDNSVQQYKNEQINDELKDLENTLTSLKRERKGAETKGEAAERTRLRITLIEEVVGALEEIYENRAKRLIESLNEELKKNFKAISHQNHEPYLTDDFEIGLRSLSDGNQLPVAKSTGENQILTLSFLAAVSKIAQSKIEKIHKNESLSMDEKTFPIVMDAAFGSLDETYQKKVAKLLAEVSNQLVILVSKSQGQGQVENALNGLISEHGVIVTHTAKRDSDPESIYIEGLEFPYVMKDDHDYSEIRMVERNR